MTTALTPIDEIVTETVTQAKEGYGLRERLQGSKRRSGRITVYTDELAGDEHLELLAQLESQQALAAFDPDEGLFDQDFIDRAKAIVVRLQAEIDVKVAELQESSFSFDILAVPPVIIERSKRAARKVIGKKVSLFDEEEWHTYNKVYVANLLSDVISGYTDNQTGEKHGKLSVDDAAALEEFLPTAEYLKLDAKVQEVQFKNSISEQVVDDADF